MMRNEAIALADKMSRSWPRGAITTETWAEVFEDLHYGPVEAAVRYLRDTHETQPPIALVKSTYRAQLGTAAEARIDCPTCGGDGWQTVYYEVFGLPNSGLKPCRCKAGQEMRNVHQNIIEANNAELARHGITPSPTRPMQGDEL